MTRANLNFVYQNNGEAPRTLFLYHNGDQYPTGLRDSFNILKMIDKGIEGGKLTPEMFKDWIKKNYQEEIEDLGEGGQPKIYFTNGFITDYSYIFEPNEIIVYNWDERIFKGGLSEFKNWIKKQV